MFNFTPTDAQQGIHVPYFEDARADFAPYYDVQTTLAEAKNLVFIEFAKLGGSSVWFQEGYFGLNPKRYGYVINFQLGGAPARMQVAGLPMKGGETEKKIARVRIQALLNVRDWLKAAVTAQVFAPGSNILYQFLLVDGHRTLGEALVQERRLPDLNPALPASNIKVVSP
ncbi:MAG: hypothetical protein K8I30_01460 [Anaerolineae bacterium]|nr:hypothetical protein [Anaerolineae bacterium]